MEYSMESLHFIEYSKRFHGVLHEIPWSTPWTDWNLADSVH